MSEAEIVNKLAHHFSRSIQVAVITQGNKTLEELLLVLTKWENVDGNVDSYSTHKPINTHKQNDNKSKQWKNPDREQNLSKFNKHTVASIAEDNHINKHGKKKKTPKVARCVSVQKKRN